MPFGFPCHHVVSMRNICAIAKWPIDKTPTPSDVLFSIPLRQNQNNRAVANKNKITFPISIPDRENLQEKKAGKRPRAKWVFVPSAINPTSAELVNNSLTLKTHKGSASINCQTLELKIYISGEGWAAWPGQMQPSTMLHSGKKQDPAWGKAPEIKQGGESKHSGWLLQTSVFCRDLEGGGRSSFFYVVEVLPSPCAAWWNNNLKKWRCRFFIADSYLYNFVNASAPWKLHYLCFAAVPAHKSRQRGKYQQLHFPFPARQRTVSPSQQIPVSCTLANTIPMFCLAVNGRSCPSIIWTTLLTFAPERLSLCPVPVF